MVEQVAKTVSRYSMFAPGQTVGVAVSGGADSVCLLHVLIELAPRWALRLCVLHLDHQLRGEESRRDAEFVRQAAIRLGLPVHIRQADVAGVRAASGDNLEQAARRVRREFLLSFLKSGVVDRVALGHTRSDQAETVLFRLLRGSGTAGLAGILPVTPEGFVRPLLDVGRTEVQQFLRGRGIPWREDSTNTDLNLARNRIRHELLPALARDWNPAIVDTLSRVAALAQDDEEYWRSELDRLARMHLIRNSRGVLLRADDLSGFPRSVAGRLIRQAIELAKGDLRQIGRTHVEQVLALAGTRDGHGRIQIPGLDVFRSFEWIRFAPPPAPGAQHRNYSVPLAVPGSFPIPENESTLRLELIDSTEVSKRSSNSGYNTGEWQLDWSRISDPLALRNWRPGDQYRPMGHTVAERVKLLFQRARVPLWERRSWPVITSGSAIVWTRRFGPAAEYVATSESRLVLRVGEV